MFKIIYDLNKNLNKSPLSQKPAEPNLATLGAGLPPNNADCKASFTVASISPWAIVSQIKHTVAKNVTVSAAVIFATY